MNLSHRNVVFVPGCLLAPALQAGDGEKNRAWSRDWMDFLSKSGCHIVQMVCPESSFDSPACGLGREPHGVGFYEALPGFCEYCLSLGGKAAEDILAFARNGYHVLAILGVEHSPTCASSYMYTHQGMKKCPGIFMGGLKAALDKAGMPVPMIGINRRYPQKSIVKFKELMDGALERQEGEGRLGRDRSSYLEPQ